MKKFNVRYKEHLTQISSLKVNDEALLMIESLDPDIEIGDEYHTIKELYEHRMYLNIALFHAWHNLGEKCGFKVIKSLFHNDGTMFEGGYFVVMAITPQGQISYHYNLKYWDKFKIEELDKAFPYDGHTSNDVQERLKRL